MVVRGNIDKDYFADGRPDLVENGVEIDVEAIARALVNIYQERIDIEHDIDDGLYRETLRIIKDAVDNGYADAIEAGTPAPDEEFRDAFEHSAEVFSAFRVHRMQNDIAAQMIDSSGKVKPFREFVRDVSSYIDHQNRAWLQTEYNTAILRAQNAAEWKQFQEEKDVYPNLEWIRSTSPNPGADHVPFWGTVLPVDDPFWDEHKPGDRWNCKCELRQTDKHSTSVPHSDGSSDAARGLESNPAKAREVFSDRHPYYPSSCVSCPFSGNKLLALFHDLAGGKHCHSCQYVNICISKHSDLPKNHRKLYERLVKDPDYTGVQYNKRTGGVKAIHKHHNFDKVGGRYEKEALKAGYNSGVAVVLQSERDKGFKERFTEGLWNGKLFEVAGKKQARHQDFFSGLKHCASKRDTEIAVIVIPKGDFDLAELDRGVRRYRGLEKLHDGQFIPFERIIIVQDSKIICERTL